MKTRRLTRSNTRPESRTPAEKPADKQTDRFIRRGVAKTAASRRGGACVTPATPGRPKQTAFDAYVHRFPGNLFKSEDGSLLFIEKNAFSDNSCREYLNNNYFWAFTDDLVAYQLETQSEVSHKTSFAGGLSATSEDNRLFLRKDRGADVSFVGTTGAETDTLLEKLVFDKLPAVFACQYLAKLPDGQLFYVDGPKYNFDYNFRAFLGEPGKMRRLEVNQVQRFRDGGTTNVTTSEGVFHYPSPFYRTQGITWTPTRGESVTVAEIGREERPEVIATLGINAGDEDTLPLPPI